EKAMGIDGLRAMWVVANERPADGISEGTGGGIGDSNAEPGAIARGEVEVVAAIFLSAGGGPGGVVGGPGNVFEIEDDAFVSPVGEIGRGPAVKRGLAAEVAGPR